MIRSAYDMLYLSACAVNGFEADKARIAEMELGKVYKVSARHSLAALTAHALARAGAELPAEWAEEQVKTLRKNILFDNEREKILRFMEESGIWYMPLKGVILKNMYPVFGVREMADNDILYDKAYQNEVLGFMLSRGYEAASVGKCHHDTYYKAPIYNFELHTVLFAPSNERFSEYYKNVKERLLPDEGKRFAYHFSDEDFYVHITAHEYKHFSASGTGLRSLLDRYVYISRKKELDFAYIEGECEKLGIADFERESRALCLKVFAARELPELGKKERDMLECYLLSTTYGTLEKLYRHRLAEHGEVIDKKAKRRYILRRIFPETEFYKEYSPLAYKYKVLIPFVWAKRLFCAALKNRKNIKKEIDMVKKIK